MSAGSTDTVLIHVAEMPQLLNFHVNAPFACHGVDADLNSTRSRWSSRMVMQHDVSSASARMLLSSDTFLNNHLSFPLSDAALATKLGLELHQICCTRMCLALTQQF